MYWRRRCDGDEGEEEFWLTPKPWLFTVVNDVDGRKTFKRSQRLNFWLINNSWQRQTATTVIPCSLHKTARPTYIITSINWRHLVWWGGCFLLDLAYVKSANRYQNDASSSALPTIPVTASVWICVRKYKE